MSGAAASGSFRYEGRDLEAMDFAVNYHRLILETFRPYLGARVVEVGAGSGSFTRLLAAEPIAALTAIEPAPEMFARLQGTVSGLRGDVAVSAVNGYLDDFSAQLRGGGVSSCVLVNVLEHVEDDVAELARVREVLDAGGHACLFVPALMALYSPFDEAIGHIRRYRKQELEDKCAAAGLTVCHARYFDLLGILPWLVRFKLLRARGLGAGSVRAYDSLGVRLMRMLESRVAPPVGKNVIVVARRDT